MYAHTPDLEDLVLNVDYILKKTFLRGVHI